VWGLICKACRTAADDGKFGLDEHAKAGCKAAQLEQDTSSDLAPYDAVLLRHSGADPQTYCDCQHRNDIQPNLARVDPKMKEELIGKERTHG
jgi:hypothetical protein